MKLPLVMEGETSDIQVHAPGFLTEVKRGSNEVILLTHLGRRSALSAASRVLQADAECEDLLSGSLKALPMQWSMSFTGGEASVLAVAEIVLETMSRIDPGLSLHRSSFAPHFEAAITPANGEILVLLQQSGHAGIPRPNRNAKNFSAHVARTEHIGVVLGAIRRFCAEDVLADYYDPLQGSTTTTWDFSRVEQVRAFLEELEPRLDDLEYCRKAGLLPFCKMDISQIIREKTEILDF